MGVSTIALVFFSFQGDNHKATARKSVEETEMADFPVMFTLKDIVTGDGYLAGVLMTGRAVVREEDDGKWWMHGVYPSGISSSGSTPGEAFANFRSDYRLVLFDLADGATFDAFRESVSVFACQENVVEEACWEAAFREMRSGKTPTEGFFSELPKDPPEMRPPSNRVMRLDREQKLESRDNVADQFSIPNPVAA